MINNLPPPCPAPHAALARSRLRPDRRHLLLHGVSATALLASAGAALPGRATAGSFRSINQAVAASAASAAGNANAAAARAAKQAGLGAQNVAQAAARFISLSQAIAGMHYQGAPVPDGVAPGGLQQAPGVAGSAGGTLWSGASTTLTQTAANGITDVTVTQSAPVASLHWGSFNIGAHTKLVFNQAAGGAQASNWVAINTVDDPSANPTTILGQISAPGKVFILNQNGILFGAGSQLNVGSLVASTAQIAQAQLTRDSAGLISGFSLYGSTVAGAITPTFDNGSATGSIVVQPGASIVTTTPTGTQGGGYVMLLADTVQNGGVIQTPQGQTVLAAGTGFLIQPGYSVSNPTSTVIGSEIAVSNGTTGTALGTLGTATNSGIILADQGDVTIAGHSVVQAGIILATTTVNTRGTVHLLTDTSDATGSVTLAPGSVTEILPEDNGQTALDSQRASNLAASVTDNALRLTPTGAVLNDYNTLADTLGESRVEISTGGSVTMQAGAAVLAQGGQVAVNGGQSIVLESGSTVDVSGTNAALPASADTLFIQGVVPYYLRDSAANRTGGLEFANVSIDERTLVEIATGTYSGNIYTAGGLLEVSGNLGLIPHGIQEWSATGGQVTLQSAHSLNGTLAGTVTVAAGSTINLTGGTVSYGAGALPQSYVQAQDGQIFNINTAPGNLVYSGVYVGDVVQHPRWQITQIFINPLLTPAEIMQPAYTVGRDAGSLTIAASSGQIDGIVAAGVTTGPDQTGARPTGITDPFLLAQSVSPLSGSLETGVYEGGSQYGTVAGSLYHANILITSSGSVPPPILTALPQSVAGTISVDAASVTADGFANITFYTSGGIAVAAPFAAANGGSVTLGGTVIEDLGSITAHDGAITLTNLLPSTKGQFQPIAQTPGTIAVAAGTVLDASGLWTNLSRDGANTSLEGYAAGGSIAVLGTGSVILAAGSVLDVSSGGILSAAGKLTSEAAGSVTVSTDLVPLDISTVDVAGAATFDAQFRGYGSGAGGTLSLSAVEFFVGGGALPLVNEVAIDPALFGSGFADYVVNGAFGVTVDDGVQVAVTRPVYALGNAAVQTGAPASAALQTILPALFAPVAGRDSIAQRAGASIALESSVDPTVYDGGGYNATIGAGASVTVDPGQSITVAGYRQVTVLGTLTAHGGTITVANTRFERLLINGGTDLPSNYLGGLSVWIGDGAILDASGVATVMTDGLGRSFGQGQAGGSIVLGGLGGANANSLESSYAQVIVRPGAVLDASGASTVVDVVPSTEPGTVHNTTTPTLLSGAGGTIVARSYDGIALDGTMLASGSGAGAAGGTLDMRLDPQALSAFADLPPAYIQPEQILVSQEFIPEQTMPGVFPNGPTDPATFGIGRISQTQLTGGGFDSVHLYAQDAIVFQGDVDLHAGRALVLETPILGDSAPTGNVTIGAPYVSLLGYATKANGGADNNGPASLSPVLATGSLTINASFVDIGNEMDIGGVRVVDKIVSNGTTATTTASATGFAETTLNSTGDIRFLLDPSQSDNEDTILASSGNIAFNAAQLYPQTEAIASVIAGDNVAAAKGANPLAGGTLSVHSPSGAAAPFSVGGTLSLIADTIVQDGVVRAPEGVINLGQARGDGAVQPFTDAVLLGAGSVTSVSLDGQTVPFGGTVDGVNYLYAGLAPLPFAPAVQIQSAAINVDPAASIDLRGGGTLSGAGFIAGRGGSADVNRTPLLTTASGAVAANTSDPVFAIVPGYASNYAPVAAADAGYSAPAPGEQITIRAGEVPGLAAGTYTLLPAYYDLLPGAFRVELTSAPMVAGQAVNAGNFSVDAAVIVGVANTGVAGATPVRALITAGAGVRQLSEYDEETYSQFAIAQAATFNAPRPLLPQDAKTLSIGINAVAAIAANDQPLAIASSSLLQSAPAGGYGATLEITAQAPLEVLAPGQAVLPVAWRDPSGVLRSDAFGLDATMLDALNVPRLVLGGTLAPSVTNANVVQVQGSTPDVLILPGADLTAGDVMLTAANTGTIHVETGATINTLGTAFVPNAAYGLAQGLYFNSDDVVGASPVLDVSQYDTVFVPNVNTARGAAITVDGGATLTALGSLDFVAPSGSSAQIGDASLHAAEVTVQVPDINIGTALALALFGGQLPPGLTLDGATLQVLAQGAQSLTLTGEEAVNIIGSVALDTGKTSLALNTPAIYGYGIQTTKTVGSAASQTITTDAGTISITTPDFTWGGVTGVGALQTGTTVVSAQPGGILALSASNQTTSTVAGTTTVTGFTSATSGAASLTIAATTIDLGNGPGTQADDQVLLNRDTVGFAAVTLQASGSITANNQSSLSVFASQPVFGQPGISGDLALNAPVITAASGAVLDLIAGGTLSASSPAAAAAATGTIATLGATIALTANFVDVDTAVALPSGKLTIDATDGITLGSASVLDLSGRSVKLFDQTAYSTGGTLVMEADAAHAAGIKQDAGGVIDVSSPGANAGDIQVQAAGGVVTLDGTLRGGADADHTAGSFSVYTGTLGTSFDALNTALDAGGVSGARNFELASGDITVDQTIAAHRVAIGADSGSIDVAATINASGASPGSIALSAAGALTLEGSAVLDAHATTTHRDSYGNEIDAENRSHVTLTSVAGTVTLGPGAVIDVSYPDAASHPQGEIVINAPRVIGTTADANSIAVSAPGQITIQGAQSVNLYGFKTYSPADANGTIVQDNGGTATANASGTLGIVQIGLNSTAYMDGLDGNTGLATQLAGLAGYGGIVHLRPGVLIESAQGGNGNLTISGDLDFSGLRYSDPAPFGTQAGTLAGSGEPGAVVFRASNDLTVNGSVSDGFALPPDETSGTTLGADVTGWNYRQFAFVGGEITNADLLLPEGAIGTTNKRTGPLDQIVLLGATNSFSPTDFDTTRPISLNYAIVIQPASINPNVVIPFALTIGAGQAATIPAGGWVATAPVTRNGALLFAKGQVIPAGFTFQPNDVLGSGTVLPVSVTTGIDATGTGQTIPAGTNFNIFQSTFITLSQDTGVLPVNALIPSNTFATFGAVGASGDVAIKTLELRPVQDIGGNMVQGYLVPLAQMLPAGSQSWSMDFTAGANLAAANAQAVQPLGTLNGGVFATAPGVTNQAPGSLLLDDLHYYTGYSQTAGPSLAFSVIRTGTGDLSLVAGGDVDQSSLYGIYTAGTQVPLGGGLDAQFDSARQGATAKSLLTGRANQAASALISATYQAYYPGGGGDVLFAAQGNVTGDVFATTTTSANGFGVPASDAIGNWLWRQGSAQLGQPTSWWINFGTLGNPTDLAGLPVQMLGFQGIGTLGGGNVTVAIGGDAGQMTDRDQAGLGSQGAPTQRGEGLIIAVGSTGRLLPGSTAPVETGGGDINVTIGGALNPIDAAAFGIGATPTAQSGESPAVNGDIVDIRGNAAITAGAIGRIDPVFAASPVLLADPRTLDPFTSEAAIPNGGIEVAPGDGTISLASLRDLVLAGAADPGRVALQNFTDLSTYASLLGKSGATGGASGFTLWQAGTAISLFSEGGSATPTIIPNQQASSLVFANDIPTDNRSIYPPSLFVTAPSGNIVYGQYGITPALEQPKDVSLANPVEQSLELAPSSTGEMSFLAGGSIQANFYAVDISGADPAGVASVFNPAFQGQTQSRQAAALTNILPGLETHQSPQALFALEADTPTTDLHANDSIPARFYAANGDLLDFQTGETLSFLASGSLAATWYIAAKPAWLLASQDIVSTGTRPAADPNNTLFASQENQNGSQLLSSNLVEYSSGNLFLNTSPQAISVISAGRDILSAYAYIGGPGLLDVQAGRNLYQASQLNVAGNAQVLSFGSFKSLGDNLIAGSPISLSAGAGISVLAGVGPNGPDTTDFADLYFNPLHQADLSLPLTDPANAKKVQQTYAVTLAAWLAANYGYQGDAAGALAAFAALPAIDQTVFVRQVFFQELTASGKQESDPNSKFYHSYERGRLAIDTLLPSAPIVTDGVPVGYDGAITMYSGTVLTGAANTPLLTPAGTAATFDGGVATLFGGTVQVIDPGGQATFGVPGGPAPGNNSGIVTYGSGDIDIYALDNVLLGKSRIFTTAGGNILIWSSAGNINAGIGAKTTQVYDPPVLLYDNVGDITDTPPAITTGAGIATLQPLPSVPAGDVALIAPEGSIDAGEAGIRVSGNLVLAAARVVGTANITVKGSTQGAPTVSVASLGAVEAAGAAAGAAANTAQGQGQRGGDTRDAASVLDVEVLSIGGTYEEEKKRRQKL